MGKKLRVLFFTMAVISAVLLTACGENDGKKVDGAVTAKFASAEIEGDFMTVWARKFADHMKKETNDKFNVTVYPYGTLGGNSNIVELCQMGTINFVFADYGWISTYVPQAQVLSLNYIWPREKLPQVLQWVAENGKVMPLLEEKFKDKGLYPLAFMFEGWQWITSKSAIKTVKDLRGVKVRVMASKMLVEDYKSYGMSPTPMAYGEIYSGLQTGLLDAQMQPMWSDYSMKFYEVAKHFVQIWSEPFIGIPCVNLKFWNSLDKDTQSKIKSFFKESLIPSAEWTEERVATDRKKIEKEDPSITFTEFNSKQVSELQKMAKSVFPVYKDIGGKDSDKILNALLSDIANAKKALNINQSLVIEINDRYLLLISMKTDKKKLKHYRLQHGDFWHEQIKKK